MDFIWTSGYWEFMVFWFVFSVLIYSSGWNVGAPPEKRGKVKTGYITMGLLTVYILFIYLLHPENFLNCFLVSSTLALLLAILGLSIGILAAVRFFKQKYNEHLNVRLIGLAIFMILTSLAYKIISVCI